MYLVVPDGDCNVQKINLFAFFTENPFQSVVLIHFFFEFFPSHVVGGSVSGRDPNPKDIINIPLVAEEVIGIFGEDAVFVDGEEKVGVGGGRGGSHRGSGFLEPERVSELKDIIFHYEGQCFDECSDGDGGEASFSLMDVLSYLGEGEVSSDVGVH